MNELIILINVLVCMLYIFVLYKLLGKNGLYISLIITIIISYLTAMKFTIFLNNTANSNIANAISIFVIMYLILNKSSKKENNKLILVSSVVLILSSILFIITSMYIPTINDNISTSFNYFFKANYRIIIFYPLLLILTQYIVIIFYNYLKQIYTSVFTNILICAIIISILHLLIYNFLVFLTITSINEIVKCSLTTYILGLIITIIYIPFIYFMNKQKKVRI